MMNDTYSFRPYRADLLRLLLGLVSIAISAFGIWKMASQGRYLLAVVFLAALGLGFWLCGLCLISLSTRLTLSSRELTMCNGLLRQRETLPLAETPFGYFAIAGYQRYLVLSPRKLNRQEADTIAARAAARPYFYRVDDCVVVYLQNSNRNRIATILRGSVQLETQ